MKVCGLIFYYTGMVIRVAGRHIVNMIPVYVYSMGFVKFSGEQYS